MSFISQATVAPQPKTRNVRLMSLLLAAFFIVMVVAQLFTFEKFADVLGEMWLPVGRSWLSVLAGVIVTCEVLALPFLFGMKLSVAMRIMSMILGWIAIGIWLKLSIGNIVAGTAAANSGLLGATIQLPTGWWTVLLLVALGVLTIWAAWGMWPISRAKKR